MCDSNFNLTFKICLQTCRHISALTDIGWHVSIIYMIFNAQLTNKGLVTCGAIQIKWKSHDLAQYAYCYWTNGILKNWYTMYDITTNSVNILLCLYVLETGINIMCGNCISTIKHNDISCKITFLTLICIKHMDKSIKIHKQESLILTSNDWIS